LFSVRQKKRINISSYISGLGDLAVVILPNLEIIVMGIFFLLNFARASFNPTQNLAMTLSGFLIVSPEIRLL